MRRSRLTTRERGLSMIEMAIAIALFALLLLILVSLEMQFVRFDRTMRVQFFTHPEPLGLLARVRRDILDSRGYPDESNGYKQSPSVLILDARDAKGAPLVVVYDFSKKGEAKRLSFRGEKEESEWTAHNVPTYLIDSYEMPGGEWAARVRAMDDRGRIAVDQIITPRAK